MGRAARISVHRDAQAANSHCCVVEKTCYWLPETDIRVGPEGVAFRGFVGPKRFRKGTHRNAPPGTLGGAWEGRAGRP